MPQATSARRFTVVLIDDHAMVREGLRALVERDEGLEVVGEAADGREGVRAVERLRPDVAVVDVSMPDLNGIEAARQIAEGFPETAVIAVSMHTDRRYVLAMFEAGASGYVAKDCAADEMLRAIHAVAEGRKYLSSEVTGLMVDGATGRLSNASGGAARAPLGRREREVLQLLAEGKTSNEIADRLGISIHTVDTHRRNIMRKSNVHSIAQLTKLAIREGLTSV